MMILIWMCLIVDLTAVLFLIISSMSSEQDSAGTGMVILPVLLLISLAALSYYLMQKQHLSWSLVASGLPVIVIIYLLFISVT
jgi:hypothetical protein